MFNIYSIYAGWMTVSFGERKNNYCFTHRNNEVVSLSYLDYVKQDLDYLFNLKDGETKNREFDLEGEFIRITTTRRDEGITIKMKYLYLPVGKEKTYEYNFPYQEFLKSYVDEMESQKESYIKDFAYHEENFEWNTNDWEEIVKKIK